MTALACAYAIANTQLAGMHAQADNGPYKDIVSLLGLTAGQLAHGMFCQAG
jgi:hypothetical protein